MRIDAVTVKVSQKCRYSTVILHVAVAPTKERAASGFVAVIVTVSVEPTSDSLFVDT